MPPSTIPTEKRRHIVETAYRLFKRDGFHATGIDRIIAEAEVAKMTMYRHFPSKDGLIVEVLDWRADRFERQLDRLAEAVTTPEQKIMTIFGWYERWFDSEDFHGCLFQHALAEFGDPDHQVFMAVAKQKTGLERRMKEVLVTSMPDGQPGSTASALFMLLEGATLLAQMGKGKTAIQDARRAAMNLLSASMCQQ